ncbi:MAG: methyl-accepting chemotaxis protein, partial [Phycisphaerae bacterium]|nr:methyl-accepting chemotaxis protein [Phycisphaerae bacterium]
MFRNMRLSTRLSLGFGVLVVIAGTLGLMGWSSLAKVQGKVDVADDANRMLKESLTGRIHEKNFIIRKDKKYLSEAEQLVADFQKQVQRTTLKLQEDQEKRTVANVGEGINSWLTSLKQYVRLEDDKTKADEQMVVAARGAITQIEAMRSDQKAKLLEEMERQKTADVVKERLAKADDANRLNKFVLEARRQEKNYILRGDAKYVGDVGKTITDLTTLAKDMKSRFKDPANQKQADAVLAAVRDYKAAFDRYVSLVSAQKSEEEKMLTTARDLQSGADGLRKEQKDEMLAISSFWSSSMMILAIAGIAIGIVLAVFITRAITKPIHRIIAGLNEGAEQVNDAAGQVSTASQTLAEGASEQAS